MELEVVLGELELVETRGVEEELEIEESWLEDSERLDEVREDEEEVEDWLEELVVLVLPV